MQKKFAFSFLSLCYFFSSSLFAVIHEVQQFNNKDARVTLCSVAETQRSVLAVCQAAQIGDIIDFIENKTPAKVITQSSEKGQTKPHTFLDALGSSFKQSNITSVDIDLSPLITKYDAQNRLNTMSVEKVLEMLQTYRAQFEKDALQKKAVTADDCKAMDAINTFLLKKYKHMQVHQLYGESSTHDAIVHSFLFDPSGLAPRLWQTTRLLMQNRTVHEIYKNTHQDSYIFMHGLYASRIKESLGKQGWKATKTFGMSNPWRAQITARQQKPEAVALACKPVFGTLNTQLTTGMLKKLIPAAVRFVK